MGSELVAAVGDDVSGNTVFGEDVFEEKDGKSFGSDRSGSLNEESHLGETVDNDMDRVKTD